MKIAIVTSEATPFSKTGGLADVTGTLFKQYLRMGHDAYLFTPLYRKIYEGFSDNLEDTNLELNIQLGIDIKPCKILKHKKHNIFFIGNQEYFGRRELYEDTSGEYPDNGARFAFFCKAFLEVIQKLQISFDIIHCNDWQTGLIPLYLTINLKEKEIFSKTHTVFTIHNLAYQGLFPPEILGYIGIPYDLFHLEGIEFYGHVSYLKAGIIFSDVITTVSKTYAKEILTPDYGFSMDGILRKRANYLYGIVNGIDYNEWNPATDPYIPYRYDKRNLNEKEKNKTYIIERCGLNIEPQNPLLCFVGRLSYQKGIGLILSSLDDKLINKVGIIILGRGQFEYQESISFLKQKFPERVFFYNGFNEELAHLIYAGCDILLMPSRYEPCGLGQMIAMRYGNIPVARETGGLADLIEDGVTGFLFKEYSKEDFSIALKVAIYAYKHKKLWNSLMKEAMSRDFSWEKSANEYLKLYSNLLS
ncbi:MAG: glycogen synthase GlgA [Thermodesulfovibrionales bacterium]|nr:glycogen synthase GlgA [Thermodesulfovibrionales bacterium]